MEKISRRGVIGAAAAFAGGMMVGQTATAKAGPADFPSKPETAKGESIYKFRMGTAPARRFGDSSIREHKLKDFPASSSMSAGLIRIAPDDFREPHWHPNSDEWLIVIAGYIRMVIVDPKGDAHRFTCGPEDVAFTPMGFGHYVENSGNSEAYVMVVHNHADFNTIELSEWVAGGSTSVFAATLNMPEEAFDDAPTKRVFMAKKTKKAK